MRSYKRFVEAGIEAVQAVATAAAPVAPPSLGSEMRARLVLSCLAAARDTKIPRRQVGAADLAAENVGM